MPRSFDGTNDELRTAIGACNITGAITMALVARRNSTAYNGLLSLTTSGGTATYAIEIEDTGQGSTLDFTGKVDHAMNFVNADGWCLLAAGKAAGTSTPRLHKYVYSTDTWSHINGGSTLADQSSVAGGTVRFGEWQDTDDFAGDITVAAIWNRLLTDAEMETLPFTLQQWYASAPSGLWLFDQSATTQQVADLTGNGANESGTGGALVGTTVSTTSMPLFNVTDGAWLVVRPQGAGGESHSGGSAGSAGAQAAAAGAKAVSVAQAARAGAQAQTAATAARSTTGASRAGARAQCVGVKSTTSANPTRAGAQAQDVGVKAHSVAAASRAGVQGAAVGAQGGIKTAASRAGAQAQSAGVKAGLSANAARSGARAATTAVRAATAAALSRAGVRAQTAGTTAAGVSGAAVARAGARSQCGGVRAVSAATQGSAGARAVSALVKRGTAAVTGRVGCQATTVAGAAARAGSALGRAGARAAVTGGVPITQAPGIVHGGTEHRRLTGGSALVGRVHGGPTQRP